MTDAPAPPKTLAILGYHKIGEAPGGWGWWYYVPPAVFRRQLAFLHDHGYEVLTLARFLDGLADPASLPARSALITFDDGYRNNLTLGLPVLREFADPAVIFVPTQYVGGTNAFDAGIMPDEPICTWDELCALERGGVAVQSHSASHAAFSTLEPARQEEEFARSKALIEQRVGRRVEFFSYPYGDAGADPATLNALLPSLGYRAACLFGGGAARLPGADPLRLPRVGVGPDTDLSLEIGDEA